MKKLEQEPALVVGVVVALIGVLAAFGLGISDNQGAAITAAVSSIFSLLGAMVTRSQVTPVAKLAAQGIKLNDAGTVMAPSVTPAPVVQAQPTPPPANPEQGTTLGGGLY